MPRLLELNWEGLSHGEDSATAARDPLSVPNGYCAIMENIEPAAGRLKPRHGCSKIQAQGTRTNVTWMGEYQKASGGYALWIDEGTVYGRSTGGSEFKIKRNWITGNPKVSSVRCGKYLILNADQEGKCLVIHENGSSLACFDGILKNEVSPLAGVICTSRTSGNGSSFKVQLPHNVAYTWVKLAPELSTDFYLGNSAKTGTGMPSAQLESWENLETRIIPEPIPPTLTIWASKQVMQEDGSVITETPEPTVNPTSFSMIGEIKLKINANPVIPAGATHLRVYMTVGTPVVGTDVESAKAVAAGSSLRWACDIHISTLNNAAGLESGIPIIASDESLGGSTNLLWSTGRDDMPPGGFLKFANGRLFVGGGSAQMATGLSGDNPGRVYASAQMDGSTDQLSRLLSFAYMTDYVDTSTDESEPCVGAGISQGNLILFNKASVWSLRGADLDYAPQQISSIGCVGAITEINQRVFFLSTTGPMVVSGSVVDPLKTMKSDLTTPGITEYSQFFEGGRKITGLYHNDSWIVTDGFKVAAYLMRGNSEGTWRIKFAEDISVNCFCFPTKGVCWVGGGSSAFYSLMDAMAVLDGTTPFLARLYTNGTIVPKGVNCGEAYSITTPAKWADSSAIKIALLGDFGRISDLYGFEESTETGSASLPVPMQRGPVMQGIPAGTMSHWFQCGVEKYIWSADTLFGGFKLGIIPRDYHAESISISDPGRPEPILDAAFIGWQPETELGI